MVKGALQTRRSVVPVVPRAAPTAVRHASGLSDRARKLRAFPLGGISAERVRLVGLQGGVYPRWRATAVQALRAVLQRYGLDLLTKAMFLAEHRRRRTVSAADIVRAYPYVSDGRRFYSDGDDGKPEARRVPPVGKVPTKTAVKPFRTATKAPRGAAVARK